MATKTTTLNSDANFYWNTWLAIEENGGVRDDGQPIQLPGAYGIVIGGSGNFDTSFTVTIQGSNDGTNWFTCHTVAGAAAVLSASVASVTLSSAPRFIRPAGSADGAGDASSVDVFLTASRFRG